MEMNEREVKDVVVRTEKEHESKLRETKEAKIKEIVQDILEKIADKKEKIRKLNEEKKALETSLDDLKNGRLDKLAELLEKSLVAKEVVKIEIIKVIEKEYVPYPVHIDKYVPCIPYTPWNQPWVITYGDPINQNKFLCQEGSNCNTIDAVVFTSGDVKSAAIGTYNLSTGSVSIR
jgi:hypothetical protein